ncbi:glycoside hydrolase family 3 N-terminal domain-containing protein [Accumulibacter sp.]|uniref:glycoside hydrolase family 3 N-terminal domain-containing protein n=1 Tax=Accumulibacter sp. TaxID=2053492 RepID=UPI0028C4D205|nr:glycoside hydrolase family 3 N-terminal domain-containing protein [Accumulibacter sp.]
MTATEKPVELLASTDWRPFRCAAQTGAAIMLAHVVISEVDPLWPAPLAKAVVQGLLRQNWGYQGLPISDDLNMGAVYRLGIGHAAVAAVQRLP